MSGSTGLTDISNILLSNLTVKTIGSGFLSNSALTNASNAFKLSNITTIGNDLFVGSPLENISGLLEGSTITTIGTNFIVTFTNLTDITNIFKSTGLSILPTDFIKNCPNINSLVGVFELNNITTIPDNFCTDNNNITSLVGVFETSNIQHIGNNFMKGSTGIISVEGIFKNNQTLQSIGNSFLSGSSLINAKSMLEGSTLTTFGSDFFVNFPELLYIENIFKSTQISELPIDFLKNCLKVTSLEGVFVNNLITSIPDEFLMNNTGITSLRYLKDSVPTSVFVDTRIESIGDSFMYGSTGLTNIDNAFEGNTTICTIGQLFLAKSKVTTANSAFKNVTNLETVGSGILMGCPLTSLISMFEGCGSLIKIGDYTEWYDPSKHDSYLYTKEKDECKCNVAGQQAEVALFTSVPYLESEFDSLTCERITDLTKLTNIFKGTGLVRTPKGFLKGVSWQTTPVLSSVLSGTSIKFINPDLMGKSNITDVSNMFTGTGVIAIPNGFMSKIISGTTVTLNWSGSNVCPIRYIPYNFLYSCTILLLQDNGFYNSQIRIIQDNWTSWKNVLYNNSIVLGFNGSSLVNFPKNFCKNYTLHYSWNSGQGQSESFVNNCINLDTIIPEGFLQNCSSFGTHFYYSNYYGNNAVKGVVSKSFLSKVSVVNLRKLFSDQAYLLGFENGFMSHSFNICANPTDTNNITNNLILEIFSGCPSLKYIPDSFLNNVTNLSTGNFDIGSMFKSTSLKKLPPFLNKVNNFSSCAYTFQYSKFTNEDKSMDVFLSKALNSPICSNYDYMFGSSSIQNIPDDSFSNVPKLIAIPGCFRESSLTKIPTYMLTGDSFGSTNVSISDLFLGCNYLSGVIPQGFCKNIRTSNAGTIFYNCTKLTGKIPSDFLLASSGYVSFLGNLASNCKGLTGFENNIWNIGDLSKVIYMQYAFSNTGFTEIPSVFFSSNFTMLNDCSQLFGISNIENIPNNFLPNAINLTNGYGIFREMSTLKTIGIGFISNSPKLTEISTMFYHCYNLSGSIPSDIFNNSILINRAEYLFDSCKINEIKSGSVFERLTNGNSANFRVFLIGNLNYTGKLPELWNLYSSNNNHGGCFGNCINASNYSSVPTGWK